MLRSETSPGDISSDRPVIASPRAGMTAQNCPGRRGNSRNSRIASGSACANILPVMPAASRTDIAVVVWWMRMSVTVSSQAATIMYGKCSRLWL
jgi:hypothetical protein